MGHLLLQNRLRLFLAVWISLALVLTPLSVFAAPPTGALAQTTIYEDPEGLFALSVPDVFTADTAITYELMGDNELDGLVTSTGMAFTTPEAPNGVSVLLLLLDEPINDQADFIAFLAAFQTAAGGETLPLVDLELVGGDDFHATGRAVTRTRYLELDIQAEENVAAILSASVERRAYNEYRMDIDEALLSFTWEPDLVQAALGEGATPAQDSTEPNTAESETPSTEASESDTGDAKADESEEPSSDTPERSDSPAPLDEAPSEPDVEPDNEADNEADVGANDEAAMEVEFEAERVSDEAGVFSISLPAAIESEDFSDDINAVYATNFTPDDLNAPVVTVAFTPAHFAAQSAEGDIDWREISDDEFNDYVDNFVVNDLSDMQLIIDERDAVNRTAWLVFETDEDAELPSEAWVWLEESDGVGAAFLVMGVLGDPINGEVFHEAVTTFSWKPALAADAVSLLAAVPTPENAIGSFEDPFGLLQMPVLQDLPFERAYYTNDTLEYSFGQGSLVGYSHVVLVENEDGQITDEQWDALVADQETMVPSLMLEEGSAGGELLSSETDLPSIDADKSAFVQAMSEEFWVGSLLIERDGVVAIHIYAVIDFYWDVFQEDVLEVIEAGIDFDPDAVREVLATKAEIGANVREAIATVEIPLEGDEYEPAYFFDALEGFNLAFEFEEPDLEGSLKAIVASEEMPDFPLAQYALWLGEEDIYAVGKSTSQNENGTRAAFSYWPDFPINTGQYMADIYYENELIAAIAFEVISEAPEESYVQHFGASYDVDDQPLVVTTAIHPDDVVNIRGTVNLPADSQIRLFWYDPAGKLLMYEIQTIRLDHNFYTPFDWIVFEPDIDWQPGYYGWVLTVDGEPIENGQLFVVEQSDIVQLSDDGADIYSILPIPNEIAFEPETDQLDFVLEISEELPSIDLVSAIDATLRWQGWEPALPSLGSPVEIDYRRWTKDGYQFVVERGTEDFGDELWLRYSVASDDYFGPLPSDDELDMETLDLIQQVARTEIEDQWVVDATMSPDGNWIAATTSDGTLYLFDALRMLDTVWYQPNAYYANPVFSPDSRDLAVTVDIQSRSEIQLFSNFDVIWLPTTRFNGHMNQVTDIAFQPDGWLVSGGIDASLRYWLPSGQDGPYMVEVNEGITGLAAAPDEIPGVLVGLVDGWIDYLPDGTDAGGWSDLAVITQAPRVAAWSQLSDEGTGEFIVYGEGQAEWYSFNQDEVELIVDLPIDNADFASTDAAFSENGELVVISGPYLTFVDRWSGDSLGDWSITVEDEDIPVLSAEFSADNRFLVVADDVGYLRLMAVPAE